MGAQGGDFSYTGAIHSQTSWRSGSFLVFWLDSSVSNNHTSLPHIRTRLLLVRISVTPHTVPEQSVTTRELIEFDITWNLRLKF